MKLFKILYLLVGIGLSALVLFYSTAGLPQKDRELYHRAIQLNDSKASEVWPNLRLGEYPVAIRKGGSEYVLRGSEITRRKPVLPVIACTAYPVGDEVNVFLLCKSEMDSIGQIAEGLSSDAQRFFLNRFSINSRKMTDNQYIAFIYHETLHAFQQKYFNKKFLTFQKDSDTADIAGTTEIEELLGKLETDPVISSLYQKQTFLLKSIVGSSKQDLDRNELQELINTREAILKAYETKAGTKNTAGIKQYIDFIELFEGTARYVELRTAVVLNDKRLEQQYLSSLQEMAQGKEKYYRSGMGMCLLLDKVDPEWKEKVFAGESTLEGLLEKTMEDF